MPAFTRRWTKTPGKPSEQSFECRAYDAEIVSPALDTSEAQAQLQHAQQQLELSEQYEEIENYRRIQLIKAKNLLPEGHELRKIQIRQLRSDALDVFQQQILKACKEAAYDKSSVPVDAPLRRVEHTDGNGMKVVDFIGQRSFIHDFNRQGRRVVSFRTDQGYVNASGFALR